jgi:hypothetical protein
MPVKIINAFVMLPLLLLLLCLSAVNVQAQEDASRFEIGVHYSALRVTEKSDKDSGLGARFTYNLNDYLAVEAEGTEFPEVAEGGTTNEVQALFGARAGKRFKRFGLFAKARPGLLRFHKLGSAEVPNVFNHPETRFAFDVGGVVEFYPSNHTAIRVDAGDTMIHYRPGDFFYQRLDEPMPVRRQLSHNLQIIVGFAFRF